MKTCDLTFRSVGVSIKTVEINKSVNYNSSWEYFTPSGSYGGLINSEKFSEI